MPGADREDRGLHPVAAPGLGEHVGDVGLHRAHRQVQPLGDLGVVEPGADQGQHVALARGELRTPSRSTPDTGPGATDPVEHRAGHLGGQDRAAGGDRAHRLDQLAAAAPLEQEPARPGRDRVEHVGVVVERGHHDHRGRVRHRGQGAGGLAGRRAPASGCRPGRRRCAGRRVRRRGTAGRPRPRRRPPCRAGRRSSSRTRRGPSAWSSTTATRTVGSSALHRDSSRRGWCRRPVARSRSQLPPRALPAPRSRAGPSRDRESACGPTPSSLTRSRTRSSDRLSSTQVCLAWAWRVTLVSASCAIR